jgi:hypothetical protein
MLHLPMSNPVMTINNSTDRKQFAPSHQINKLLKIRNPTLRRPPRMNPIPHTLSQSKRTL